MYAQRNRGPMREYLGISWVLGLLQMVGVRRSSMGADGRGKRANAMDDGPMTKHL